MPRPETFYDLIRRQGISRRNFLKFCSLSAASLGLAPSFAPRIAHAMETKPRVPVLWLHGLECTCCSESFIRSAHPLVKDVILSMISLDYDDTIMAAAGHQAEAILEEIRTQYKGNYVVAVEGNPPLNEDGMYCIVGGRPFVEQLKDSLRRRRGGDLLGLVRLVGLRAGRQAEPDAGDAGPQGHHRQADRQGAGLPADRRGHDRRDHLPA